MRRQVRLRSSWGFPYFTLFTPPLFLPPFASLSGELGKWSEPPALFPPSWMEAEVPKHQARAGGPSFTLTAHLPTYQ